MTLARVKEVRQEIRDTKREMREQGIRTTSCFNGGLSSSEYSYNSRLFKLKSELMKATNARMEG